MKRKILSFVFIIITLFTCSSCKKLDDARASQYFFDADREVITKDGKTYIPFECEYSFIAGQEDGRRIYVTMEDVPTLLIRANHIATYTTDKDNIFLFEDFYRGDAKFIDETKIDDVKKITDDPVFDRFVTPVYSVDDAASKFTSIPDSWNEKIFKALSEADESEYEEEYDPCISIFCTDSTNTLIFVDSISLFTDGEYTYLKKFPASEYMVNGTAFIKNDKTLHAKTDISPEEFMSYVGEISGNYKAYYTIY